MIKNTQVINRDFQIRTTLKLNEVSEEHTKNDVMIQNQAWINFMKS